MIWTELAKISVEIVAIIAFSADGVARATLAAGCIAVVALGVVEVVANDTCTAGEAIAGCTSRYARLASPAVEVVSRLAGQTLGAVAGDACVVWALNAGGATADVVAIDTGGAVIPHRGLGALHAVIIRAAAAEPCPEEVARRTGEANGVIRAASARLVAAEADCSVHIVACEAGGATGGAGAGLAT